MQSDPTAEGPSRDLGSAAARSRHAGRSRLVVYVVARMPGERARIEARHQAPVAAENAIGFDPGRNPAGLAVLQEMVRTKPR